MIAVDRIKHFADVSISRACGFGFIAIATGAVGFYWDMVAALRFSATGVTFMTAFLLWKALEAPSRDYRRTEVFLLMNKRHDLPEGRAQQVFGNVLRERYLWHATVSALAATLLWALAFLRRAVAWTLAS